MMRELKIGRVTFPVCVQADGRHVAWWKEGSARRRVTAKDWDQLKGRLQKISAQLLSGELDAAQLGTADHRAYLAARTALAPFHLAVDLAAREYAAARGLLGEIGLLDAVRFYKRHAGVEIIERTVSAAVLEFLQSQASENLSESYRRQCRQDLARFAARFGEKLLSEISAGDIDSFVDGTGHERRDGERRVFVAASGSRRNQVRGTVITLFKFSRDRKYLLAERSTQADAVKRRKAVGGGKPVWTPAHLRRALESTLEHERAWLPWLAISALTNMRTGAILRLDWSDFHWEASLIEVAAAHSKVETRFVVRMSPALAAWLEPWRHARGPVMVNKRIADFTGRLRSVYGLPYQKNVLRHSWISYRLAESGQIEVVADEANTSAKKIRSNYRQIKTVTGEMVTKETAEKWLGLMPEHGANVIQASFAL